MNIFTNWIYHTCSSQHPGQEPEHQWYTFQSLMHTRATTLGEPLIMRAYNFNYVCVFAFDPSIHFLLVKFQIIFV